MLSYHSDPAIKHKYLARVEGHAAADEIIKGRYWEAGKGCAVGCTIHGAAHSDFEHELGIPQILAWLEDVIFEGLPNRLAKTWPERFLSAIEPGKDLSRVGWQLLHWLLTDTGFGETDHPAVRHAVTRCRLIIEPLLHGHPPDRTEAEQAAALAWAAAEPIEADPAISAQARWLAESAARAAESVALSVTGDPATGERAATAITAAIARSADYITVSEQLIVLLKAA